MKIRTKTLLITFLPIIILVLIAITVLFQLFEKTSTAVVIKRDSEIARITAERISEGLSRYYNHLQDAAHKPVLSRFIKYKRPRPVLSDAYLRSSFDKGFALFNKTGHVLWSDIKVSSSLLNLFSSTEAFKRIEKTLRPVFSDILKDPQNGFQVFIVAVPVTDRKGSYIGALCGIAQLEYSFIEVEFAHMLEIQSGYSGYAYLVDGKGRLIYHRRHELIGNDFKEFEPVRLVLQRKTGAIITKDLEGNMVIGGFAPVPGTSWNVVTHERWDIILQQVLKYAFFAGALMLGGILFISIFLFIGIGRALKPIQNLITATEQVASGNFNFRVHVESGDEFSVLSSRFNKMASELNGTYEKLQEQVKTVAEKERIMTTLLSNLPGMVFRGRYDNLWSMDFISEGSLLITGYTTDELTGDKKVKYRDLVHPEDREYVENTLREEFQEGNSFEVIHRIYTKEKKLRWVYVKGSKLNLPEGPSIIEGFISDITELRMKDEQLKQAQKMEMIGNLAGGIAHDFNNVLVGISGPMSILKIMLKEKGVLEGDKIKEYLDIIDDSSIRASNLVKQLLSMARKHDLNIAPVDLNNSISKIVNVTRSSLDKSIKISHSLLDTPAIVLADETQIEQCLLNLCINASHAMTTMREGEEKHGGELNLEVKNFHPDRKFRERYQEITDVNYYKITIHDTGVGIDSESLGKIFDPFFSTKPKNEGSGLGLSMVYNIIRDHRGLITVYSEPGIGTTFNIFLPCEEDVLIEKKDIDHDMVVKGSGYILVVDDEETMRITAREILEEAGYDIITAGDGPEALKIYKKEYKKLDMAIIDMAMPQMYGDELFRKMKRINPKVKVLLASGFTQDQRAIKILSEGVKGFLQKPFTINTLTSRVKEIITRD